MTEVLAEIHWTPVKTNDIEARGRCPIHPPRPGKSELHKFAANLKGKGFQCFGCGAKGNAFDLWCLCTVGTTKGPRIHQAAIDLMNRLRIK